MTEQFHLPEHPLRVVVMACSASKLGHPAPADELYTGIIWQAWRKHQLGGSLGCGWQMLVLSAEHGLLEPHQTIHPYDRKLSRSRVGELAPMVAQHWVNWAAWRHELEPHYWPPTCCVIGGDLYQELAAAAELPVELRIDGSSTDGQGGIGLLRRRVGDFAETLRREANRTPHAEGAWKLP